MPFPVIAGDIGGTNSRFRVIGPDGAAMGETVELKNAEYPSVIEAVILWRHRHEPIAHGPRKCASVA